jgi:hypothetical protein
LMSATLNAMGYSFNLWFVYGLSNAVCVAIRDSG